MFRIFGLSILVALLGGVPTQSQDCPGGDCPQVVAVRHYTPVRTVSRTVSRTAVRAWSQVATVSYGSAGRAVSAVRSGSTGSVRAAGYVVLRSSPKTVTRTRSVSRSWR